MMKSTFFFAALLVGVGAWAPRVARTKGLPRKGTLLKVSPLVDASTIVVSDLVAATEVYGPIFGMGIILSISGFASAMVVGNLVGEDNIDDLSDQFYEKGLKDIADEVRIEAKTDSDDYLD